MTLFDSIILSNLLKALTATEYEALYNWLVFIGVIVIVLVMIYVLVGREPEEEE
ncbi:MAG: hypothetical protein ACTSRP_08100 [Candidatus Helarchaeota archaeon]